MKKKLIIGIIGVIIIAGLIIGGVCAYQSKLAADKKKEQAQTLIDNTRSKGITYRGKQGMTALELLERNATVIKSGTGENAFVTSINGVAANSQNQYWAFYVNDEPATVGAGSYNTKPTDTISWRLASF